VTQICTQSRLLSRRVETSKLSVAAPPEKSAIDEGVSVSEPNPADPSSAVPSCPRHRKASSSKLSTTWVAGGGAQSSP
jgi:hypothetical protein